jgi:hypothetical protein
VFFSDMLRKLTEPSRDPSLRRRRKDSYADRLRTGGKASLLIQQKVKWKVITRRDRSDGAAHQLRDMR